MPARTILPLILGMLVLPVFPQDAPRQTSDGDATVSLFGSYATVKKRAEQGDRDAQFYLGFRYAGGGRGQDYKEAARWYRAAAEQDHRRSQFWLGYMYDKGQGVPQHYKEAVRWYREAAEQGETDAQFSLGLMYGKGQGVAQDSIQAHMWFNLAASNYLTGDARDTAVKNRDEIAEKMTAEQIAEAQRLAREWKPKTGGQ